MKQYDTLRLEENGEVLTVYLDDPPLNLFTSHMMEELVDLWHALRLRPDFRFVVLTAKGDHFSAGVDLRKAGSDGFTPLMARTGQLAGHEIMRSLESLEQVTVAALRGVVCGAGMAVAMACDFRIMTESSYYLVPETLIGTYFTWGCTPRLVRMVGASKAMEIVMACDPVPAAEAHRLNLANLVVPDDGLEEAVQGFVEKIAAKSPTCIRLTKKIALGASMEGFGNTFIVEPELMQVLAYSGETVEGVTAFMDKRPPKFPKS